ncbi:MAG: cadherin-like domain-containing protein [Kiritimatiellae bacterium]|nr:cadherin-like domain-containing protein [Kiritimatiellia bacterium]
MNNLFDRENRRIATVKKIAVHTLCLLASITVSAAGISEPATTFYGKVLGMADVQPHLITTGQLTWVIRRADGADVTLRASLFSYNEGVFSYRLDVPHSALALGLSATAASVPLTLSEQTHQHLSVTLDGVPVTLLGPAGSSFTTAQLLRSATYRLDLGVYRHAEDSDGDGIPDWWEDLYGLDKQADDANQVCGTGGLTAAQSYALGLDPNADHTVPALTTAETVVYAGGSTALILDAFDLDTAPSNLVYTVTALPYGACGVLAADGTPVLLEVGSTFTQDDVRQARLIYRHEAEVADPGVMGLALSDGQHAPVEASVRLLLYEPALNEVSLRSDLYQYANAGFIVAEGAVIDASSSGQAYVLVGADAAGGFSDDVIYCGAGNPARAAGGPGSDRFIVTDLTTNGFEIIDFSLMEGDVLDLSQLPVQEGTPLLAAFSLAAVEDGYQVTYPGGTVRLGNFAAVPADLLTLVEQGSVWVPEGVVLETRVSVAATVPSASRTGPVNGVFAITRTGRAEQEIVVNLLITGSAVNGSDYAYLPNTAIFPAGVKTVEIAVTPYVLSGALEKVVALVLQTGSGYVLGNVQQAAVTIEPLKSRVYIDVFEPLALAESGVPASFILSRDGLADTSLIVKLVDGGSAVKNVDYVPLSTSLTLLADEDERLIDVMPLATATFPEGPKKVTLAVLPSVTGKYLVGTSVPAEVTLVDRYDTFEDWLSRQSGGFSALAAGVFDKTAEERLFRLYAFGANADGSNTEGLPRPLMIDGQMVVKVKQPFWLSDVTYSARGFTDLTAPEATAVGVMEVDPPAGETAGAEWRYYRLGTAGPRGFISVDVESF